MKKERAVINGPRQFGTVADWKGSFGWIEPLTTIKHPLAHKRNGRIYLGAEDVAEELDGVGADVNFTLYADQNGLGAADCRMGKAPPPAKKPGMPQQSNAVAAYKAANSPVAKAAAKAAANTPAARAAAVKVAQAKAKAAVAKAKAQNAARDVQQPAFQKQQQQQKGKWGNKNGGDQGKGEREILHDEPLLGTVVTWKGKFGWVKPHDTIEHPMADKHQGDLFLAHQDVEEEIEGVGSIVQFMLYGDSKGLGASNVRPA